MLHHLPDGRVVAVENGIDALRASIAAKGGEPFPVDFDPRPPVIVLYRPR